MGGGEVRSENFFQRGHDRRLRGSILDLPPISPSGSKRGAGQGKGTTPRGEKGRVGNGRTSGRGIRSGGGGGDDLAPRRPPPPP